MTDWDLIMAEAERLERDLRQRKIDPAEAEKIGDYFISHDYDEKQLKHYLDLLASDPPIRSKLSKRQYQALRDSWQSWRTGLTRDNKAKAWGWAVRLAKTKGNI